MDNVISQPRPETKSSKRMLCEEKHTPIYRSVEDMNTDVRIRVGGLRVGDTVICQSLFGKAIATVTEITGTESTAEDDGNLYLLTLNEAGYWSCNSAINKRAFRERNDDQVR